MIYSLPPNVRSVDIEQAGGGLIQKEILFGPLPPPHLNYVPTPMQVGGLVRGEGGGGFERALAEANSVLPPHPISISPLHVNFPPPLPFSSFGG